FRIYSNARTFAKYRSVSKEPDTGATAVYDTKDPRDSESTAKLALLPSIDQSQRSQIQARQLFRINSKSRTLAKYRSVTKEPDTGATAVYDTKDPRDSESTAKLALLPTVYDTKDPRDSESTAKLALLPSIDQSQRSQIQARQLSMTLRIQEIPNQQQSSALLDKYRSDTKDPRDPNQQQISHLPSIDQSQRSQIQARQLSRTQGSKRFESTAKLALLPSIDQSQRSQIQVRQLSRHQGSKRFRINSKARTLAKYRSVSKEPDTGATAVYDTKDPRDSESTAKLGRLPSIEPFTRSRLPLR
ncbi:hypothetical protein J6590_104014, partial [Homalodisca vitripennis]